MGLGQIDVANWYTEGYSSRNNSHKKEPKPLPVPPPNDPRVKKDCKQSQNSACLRMDSWSCSLYWEP